MKINLQQILKYFSKQNNFKDRNQDKLPVFTQYSNFKFKQKKITQVK